MPAQFFGGRYTSKIQKHNPVLFFLHTTIINHQSINRRPASTTWPHFLKSPIMLGRIPCARADLLGEHIYCMLVFLFFLFRIQFVCVLVSIFFFVHSPIQASMNSMRSSFMKKSCRVPCTMSWKCASCCFWRKKFFESIIIFPLLFLQSNTLNFFLDTLPCGCASHKCTCRQRGLSYNL